MSDAERSQKHAPRGRQQSAERNRVKVLVDTGLAIHVSLRRGVQELHEAFGHYY